MSVFDNRRNDVSDAIDEVYRTPAIILAADLTELSARSARLERERDEERAARLKAQAERDGWAAAVGRLLAERDSLERERDEAREQVRSLTVERDAARLPEAERADLWGMIADRDRRLSRAREALGSFDENPPPYRAGHLVEGEWRIHQARALAALRAALAEPLASS